MFEAAQITASISAAPACPSAASASCAALDRHLGQDRDLLVRPLGDDRAHDRRVEDARLVCITKRDLIPDAFSMNSAEEGGDRLDLAGGDGGGVLGVEPFDVGVEGHDQLGVRDAFGRGIEAGRGDDCRAHGKLRYEIVWRAVTAP